jgi:hypothetical protein
MKEPRHAAVVIMVSLAATPGCFWSKKPATAGKTPSTSRPISRKSAAQGKPAAAPARRETPRPSHLPAAVPAEPAGAHKLKQILTAEEEQELTQEYIRSVSSARQDLAVVAPRRLTAGQAETMRLVRSFLSQAERSRLTDISVAVQLARRAEVLARSLRDSGT